MCACPRTMGYEPLTWPHVHVLHDRRYPTPLSRLDAQTLMAARVGAPFVLILSSTSDLLCLDQPQRHTDVVGPGLLNV